MIYGLVFEGECIIYIWTFIIFWLAKVLCCGNNREEARRRMYRALREFVVTGVKTTIPLGLKIIEDKTFISGKYDTSYLEDFLKNKQ